MEGVEGIKWSGKADWEESINWGMGPSIHIQYILIDVRIWMEEGELQSRTAFSV
jgi:hypothetical protein